MRAPPAVPRYYMNILPNQNTVSAGEPNAVIVTLTLTETSTLSSSEGNPEPSELPVERALQHRATAMTDVLSEIMERPLTPRYWGLNE